MFAKRLKSKLAVIIKRRPEPDVSEVTHIVGDVEGKIAVVVDDMISTGGTLVKAAEALLKRGATDVYTLATHGIFAGDAIEQFENSEISKVIVTNTIPRTHRLGRRSSNSRSRRSSPTQSSASPRTARSPSSSTPTTPNEPQPENLRRAPTADASFPSPPHDLG